MSYTALYRKWRPNDFTDVKGQDHIVTTLKNQIKADRIGHAYLFCGTRGTGKTTIAKILAKAVNCERPVDGSPCCECETCLSIAAGTSMNVIEIDAASNNGVDNIREIRDEVQYSPTSGKYKVYIIDEVHMLSIGAFNALLKTLEEPPAYVIFILATTEAHKIPITILSRCQRYDFKRISIDTITDRLSELMVSEKVNVEEKALRYIAKAADGSLRDALSLLDQCIAFYLGKDLKYDNVLEVLGAVDTEVFSKLLSKVLGQDIAGCIHLLEELVIQGRDLGQFVIDFVWYLRNLLLIKSSENVEDVIDASAENLELLKEQSQLVDSDTLMRYIRIFSELSNNIKYSSQKRILVEIALIKLTKPAMEQSKEIPDIISRLTMIEKQLEEGVKVNMQQGNSGFPASGGTQGRLDNGMDKDQQSKKRVIEALPEELKTVATQWNNIIQSLEDGALYGMLMSAHVTISEDGGTLELIFEALSAFNYVNREEYLAQIEKVIEQKTNRHVHLKAILLKQNEDFHNMFTDIRDLVKIDIEIEDDKEDLI
ncbi:DNA polymerase III subunit gamma/tau [[Clostridium] fimetarium]|uniref:DNA-directed DNA polymerase n=1 Tax=[Clostridium] fimetarium TaxID=99656 RepID=A0A1I0NYE4_9FIRM|nr:DNA polymerase III subunit gamma/tau [[Clostridium] fimetarium]SEW06981.1 DNA polymerase-3 subunit gamma/tau [[Clostridium] fimetarium]